MEKPRVGEEAKGSPLNLPECSWGERGGREEVWPSLPRWLPAGTLCRFPRSHLAIRSLMPVLAWASAPGTEGGHLPPHGDGAA